MRHTRPEPQPFRCPACERDVVVAWHAWQLKMPRCVDCDNALEPRFVFPPELAEGLHV